MPNFDFNVTDYACYSLSHCTAWMLFCFVFFVGVWVFFFSFFFFFLVKTNYSQNGLIHFFHLLYPSLFLSVSHHTLLSCA